MKVVNYVQIDFSKNKDITVPSMQYDSGSRWVRLKLFNNGIPVNLNGIRVCIMVAKPDGKEVFNDCVIVDAENGLVEFEITNQMVVVAGEVECQIKLMEQDKLLSSEIFTLFVNKGLTPTNIDSENELNVLVDALNRVEHLDQELSGEIMASFEASQTQRDETFKEKLLEYDERFLEIKGEKGDKGDKGDTGERGLQGPVGPQGSKGDVGEQGPVGPQGPKGDKGDQGEVGAIGPIGLQGPIGLTGPQGETGPQGPKGEKGLDGRSVELGVYGGQVKWRYAGQEENVGWTPLISLDSLRGSQGPQGEKGETGPQGPKGEKGDSGGVMPADMVDYMGNQHETLKAKNDADVDWLLGEINTAHYEGQQITATDSIEGRAKSAILKGQTLINLATNSPLTTQVGGKVEWVGGKLRINFANYSWSGGGLAFGSLIKPSTKYTIYINVVTNNCEFKINAGHYKGWNEAVSVINPQEKFSYKNVITTNSDTTANSQFYWFLASENPANFTGDKYIDVEFVILEGEYIGIDIPYFTGMQSVKMPVLTTVGKNLNPTSIEPLGLYDSTGANNNNSTHCRTDDFINVTPNKVLTVSSDHQINRVFGYDTDGNYLGMGNGGIIVSYGFADKKQHTFTVPNNCHKIKITSFVNTNTYFQLEEGTTATNYEPFKSNILSINGEYRGIGNVQDTLDLNTGEKVERIGEMILNGNEKWATYSGGGEKEKTVAFRIPSSSHIHSWGDGLGACDKLPFVNGDTIFSKDIEGITSDANGFIIRISKKKCTDLQSLKVYLLSNPIKIQYRLKTPIIKTVDLSDYHVYSFKDTTHYSCGSEDGSLIPSLSIDVPTNLPAVVTRQKTMIHELEVENKALIDELQRVEEKSDQADLEQLSTTWEIDYRVSELEWFVEDNISSTMTVAEKINLKLGGNTMALSRFEQAKILILAGAYNRETLEKQLTNYLKRGYLTTEEYDELIALMDAKELVSEN